MITLNQYIDECKDKSKACTIAALARAINTKPQYLQQAYKAQFTLNDSIAARLSELVGDDPRKGILIAQYTTASEVLKPIWIRMFEAVEKDLRNQKRNQKKMKSEVYEKRKYLKNKGNNVTR